MPELFPLPDLFRALLYALPAWRSCGLLFAFLCIMPPPLLTKVLFVQYKKHVPPVNVVIQRFFAYFRAVCFSAVPDIRQGRAGGKVLLHDQFFQLLYQRVIVSDFQIRPLFGQKLPVFPVRHFRAVNHNFFQVCCKLFA